MQKLAEGNVAKVLDVLTARCAYERTGVKLYDAIIDKIERQGDTHYHRMLETLRRHRDEEKEHEEWLEQQIRALGGDPHAATQMSRLEDEETRGVQGVLLDGHSEIPHLIHALFTAELTDNAGWDLLVQLADEAGDREAKREFGRRLAEEAKHLLFMREAMTRTAEREILGEDVELPARPTSMIRVAARRPLGIGMLIFGFVGAIAAIAQQFRKRTFALERPVQIIVSRARGREGATPFRAWMRRMAIRQRIPGLRSP